MRKGLRNLDDLPRALVRAEINGRADRRGAHVIRLLHRAKKNLVEAVGERHKFVVIDFHNERNLVGVFARDRAEHAEGRGHRVTAAFDGQLDDILSIKIIRVLRKAGTAGMLDALVHGKNREIAAAAKAPTAEHPL